MRHPFSRWLGVLSLLLVLGFAGAFALNLGRFRSNTFTNRESAGLPLAAIQQSGEGEASPLPTMTSTVIIPTPGRSYLSATAYVVATPRPEWLTTPTATQPPPTPTPLPTVSADNTSPYAAQNLVLVPGPTPVSPKFQDQDSRLSSDIAWSPDGSLFAVSESVGEQKLFQHNDGTASVWERKVVGLFDASGQKIDELIEGTEPLWSPTGEYIAVQYWDPEQMMGSPKIIELSTRKISIVTTTTYQNVRPSMTWISDTELLFYLGDRVQGELLVFDVVSGKQHPLLTKSMMMELTSDKPDSILYRIAAFPAKGLIAVDSNAHLYVLQRDESGVRIVRVLEDYIASGIPVFAPDGDAIAYVSGSGLRIISLIDPDQKPVHIDWGDKMWPVIWSPDGSSLLFKGPGGWNVINRDGSGLRLLSELSAETWSPTWTTHGLWIMDTHAVYRVFVISPN